MRKAKHVCDFVRLPFGRLPGYCKSAPAREVFAFTGGRAANIFWRQALTGALRRDNRTPGVLVGPNGSGPGGSRGGPPNSYRAAPCRDLCGHRGP